MGISAASQSLSALLERDGDEARAIREAFHRTMLWRYATGRRKPDAEGVAQLARLSNGEVPADGWEDLETCVDAPEPDAAE